MVEENIFNRSNQCGMRISTRHQSYARAVSQCRCIHSRHLPAGVSEEIAGRIERLVRGILTELMNNFARTLVLVRHHKPLRGGTSAPQNLQGTVWLFLFAGTT
jgi:hypothetical protein